MAEVGNKNAEKWTVETVTEKLKEIEGHAKKPNCLWLGTALVEVGLYREVWAYWKDKFKSDPSVFQTIKRIEGVLEDRLVSKMLNGDLNTTASIFTLKNNNGWTDKKEIDHTSGGNAFGPIKVNVE